ncbi:MAG: response regulator [Myxococcales bacterium]
MQPQAAIRSKKRILIVDDESDSSDILAQFLGAQYDVIVARDGLQGIEQAARHRPDLIISDVSMPKLGGLDMARVIRVRHGLRAPIIFVSGKDSPKDIIAAITAGARHYLTKPVDLQDLKKRVVRALEQS